MTRLLDPMRSIKYKYNDIEHDEHDEHESMLLIQTAYSKEYKDA